MSFKRAEHAGVLLSGPKASVELIEREFAKLTGEKQEVLWSSGGITIEVDNCGCKTVIDKKEDFPEENLRCTCGKNFFVKYRRDVTVVDLSELKENHNE